MGQRLCAMANDEVWDEQFHDLQKKVITAQLELLAFRREHENEVLSLIPQLEAKEAALDEAQRTLATTQEKTTAKADKLKVLNAELSEVQLALLQTEKEHKSKQKKLTRLREGHEANELAASETRLKNESMRNELKSHNRTLATKQTELIGYRHEIYTLKQSINQMRGEDLEELDAEELKELQSNIKKALSGVEEQESDWVAKQLEYFESEIQFALAEEDFAKAGEMKKKRDELRESEGIPISPKGKARAIDPDDDDEL